MLELRKVSHRYDRSLVLDQISLQLGEGEIGCILGPSGCGKTTLLRCIAGFESLADGEILVRAETISSVKEQMPPEDRRIGMVFQDYALLPHLTSLQNVMFGLHEKPRRLQADIAASTLAKVGLADFADRYPHELSGGQQQRVAIARALAPSPTLLLMDEPFSNIDASMRADLGGEVKILLNQLGTTALVATHDHHDAFALSDMLGVMDAGTLLQWDSAYAIYHEPASRFVADFVGRGVWLKGRVLSSSEIEIEPGTAHGTMTHDYPDGTDVELFLRPDDVVHDDTSELQAEVISRRFRGSEFLYELRLPSGATLLSSVPSHHDHSIGEMVGIRIQTDHLVVFLLRE